MSNLQPSSVKFSIIAFLVLVTTGGLLALLWPMAIKAAQVQAGQLVAEATLSSGGAAEADFQLATWLDHDNTAAHLGLAQQQYAADQPAATLQSLNGAGDSPTALELKVQTLLELGRYADAANVADQAIKYSTGDAALQYAAFAYVLAGRQADATILEARVSSPEAASAIKQAEAGPLPLAMQLYASGLLNSSNAVLLGQPESFERDLLLGKIYASSTKEPNLVNAAKYLRAASTIQPSNPQVHQLLEYAYTTLGQSANASQQAQLISNIKSGRP
jgi:predicted Zn-dependent protease